MQITSAQCWTRLTSTSEYLDCHFLLWNKLITIVFVNSRREDREPTVTDNLFNEIHNKTMPTSHFVRSPRKWLRTWAMLSCLNCSKQNLKRNAKSAFLHWNSGIIYCTCGHLLKESEANRGVMQCTLNLLSIPPNYVIKKGRLHGHRYVKTTEQRVSCCP